MRHVLPLGALVLLVCCAGCGDSHESLAKDSVSNMKEMVAILDGVKDQASAHDAKPKLKSLMEKQKDIDARQNKLGAPSEDEMKTIDSKYSKEMEELQQKFNGQMMR